MRYTVPRDTEESRRNALSVAGLRPASPSSMLDLEFTELSDRGRVRKQNEDYLGHAPPATPAESRTRGWLFALADGVGGHRGGEIASRAAVESVLAGFRAAAAGASPSAVLPELVRAANTRVYEAGLAAGPAGAGMSTTIVACALQFDRVVVAHVGDSRCYLIRAGRAAALTRDHTVASEQARLGLLSPGEAAEVSTRHVLSRSLGSGLFVDVETCDHQVMAGDALLLCSDGLYAAVTDEDMAHLVTPRSDLASAARELVALANQRDGSDNISVQLVRVRSVERVGMFRGRPYRLR